MMVSGLSTRLLNICMASFCKAWPLERAEAVIIDGIRLRVAPDVFVSLDAAYFVVHRMKEAGISPDVITYNSLLSGATRNCLLSQSLDLFEEML
ncbi:hypothetical protein ACFX13_045263 [Malus domestica]